MAGKQLFAFLVVALCACRTYAQVEEGSKSGEQGTSGTTEYRTLSPPPPSPDPLVHNLQFSLPIVTVSIILFIMAIVIIIVMRKARYGQFCCLKPKMRFRYVDDDDEELGNGGEGSHTPPPTYKMVEVIAPPDYSDALQDVLVSQSKPGPTEEGGEPQGHTGEDSAMVNVPLDENETEDDRTPLNP